MGNPFNLSPKTFIPTFFISFRLSLEYILNKRRVCKYANKQGNDKVLIYLLYPIFPIFPELGHTTSYMVICYHTRPYLPIHHAFPNVTKYDQIRPCITTYMVKKYMHGHVWSCVVIYGHVLSCRVMYGHVWSLGGGKKIESWIFN